MKTQTLLVGSGKLAFHLQHYFTLREIPFRTWNRRQQTGEQLQALLAEADQVLLLVSDSALSPFINSELKNYTKRILHCSGSLVIAGAQSFHPLMTFSQELQDLSFYEKIPFIHNGEHSLQEFFPQLRNPEFVVPDSQRALYHAYCVISGNFTNLLWQECELGFSRLGLPREAWTPYLSATFENIKTQAKGAKTGPLARKDRTTVQKNLAALSGSHLFAIYQSFVHSFFPEYHDENHS